MAYDTEVLADSPVLYWRFGEPSGTTAEDATANNRDGTYIGATLGHTGAISGDTAAFFDGTDDGALRADEAALDLGDTVTVEAWLKRASTGSDRGIISKGNSSFYLRLSSDGTLFLIKSQVAGIVSSTVAITDTTSWHHVVATKTGATVKLYIDGADVTGTVTNSTLTNNTTALTIGCDDENSGGVSLGGASEFFHGYLDEIAVYPTALSAGRVLAHYDAGTAVAVTPPDLYVVRSSLRLA